MKVIAINNIIRKLANSKWGCNASTLRPSCLALCYSAAEYACPVWARSTHARRLNPALHDCCRIISGCLKPTNLDSVYLQAGIAHPHIRRNVACRMERTRQTTDARHQLFHHRPDRRASLVLVLVFFIQAEPYIGITHGCAASEYGVTSPELLIMFPYGYLEIF